MRLNTLAPGTNKKRRRVGRGIGSGLGKTCGRGHKGQHSRSGGYHKVGFEGGQMPIQRRLPKFGFRSHLARITAQLRLDCLNSVEADVIDLRVLITHNVLPRKIKRVKIVNSGTLNKAITIKGLRVTKGAKLAIEAMGGTVEE